MARLSIIVLFGLSITAFFTGTYAEGFGPGRQNWGYVDVREGAHMFYWLFYTTANVTDYTQKPLIIWLDGGPGVGGTGFGNFREIGPLNLELKPRNNTWVQYANALFIDNPVGSGFSYVDDAKYLTTDNRMITNDLLDFMKAFYSLHPEFKSVPIHFFGESYGGKMEVEIALELYRATQKGEIESNVKSVALGDAWIAPLVSVYAMPPLLLYMGFVGSDGYDALIQKAVQIQLAYDAENYTLSASMANSMWNELSSFVDLYNIMALIPTDNTTESADDLHNQMLDDLMRGPVSKALNIPANVVWGSQREITFNALLGDLMKPVVHIVEQLLDTTDIEVNVYTGQLDLTVPTPATEAWVNSMRWKKSYEYAAAPRKWISINGILQGYEKKLDKLRMFWINRAGHDVPIQNPAAMDYVLNQVIHYDGTD